MESSSALLNPYFLALTSANQLKAVNFNCDDTKQLKFNDLGTLASDVVGFDYLVMQINNKPYLFVFYSSGLKKELKVSAFEIDETATPPKFVEKPCDYKELTDAFINTVFDDLRNFRYLRVVHHPSKDIVNDVDFIVDGNDVKIFLLGGSFTPKLSGDNVSLSFTTTLQTKFRKSSISRTSFCDSTKNYIVCQ